MKDWNSLKSDNLIIEVIFGIIFLSIGLYLLLNRKNVIGAFLSSNKVFWKNIGFFNSFLHNEKVGTFLTNIMIPFMGVVFLAGGVLLIVKILIIYMK